MLFYGAAAQLQPCERGRRRITLNELSRLSFGSVWPGSDVRLTRSILEGVADLMNRLGGA